VIFVAGADPYRRDRFGRMALSKRGLFLRDRMVLGHFRRRGVPVAVTLGGGYAPDIGDIVDIHANTVRLAARSA
jgi:acetoin utilization deacetylase AcuC-like enzyme